MLCNMVVTSSPHTRPRATDRGLALLSAVADRPEGLTLADAARAVDLVPSTAMRQLRSLESAGFVERRADGRYHAGPELLRIARHLVGSTSLTARAAASLTMLSRLTGESAYLAEPLDRTQAVYVAMEQSPHSVRHVSWLGRSVPRRGTAVGAALAGRVDAVGTVVRRDAVEPGITAVSAPVRDVTGRVVAALSVVGPSFRLDDDRVELVRELVRREADALGDASRPTG
jgi:urocanate hydratase